MTDPRYPYTYACDFIREHCGEFKEIAGARMTVPSISRAQASQVMHAFEAVFGMTHEEMAKKLADYAAKKEATQ